MNSHQINLYLADSDRVRFESALRRAEDFTIIDSITDGDSLRLLDTTDMSSPGEQRLKVYLASPKYLDSIQLSEVPTKSYKSIDIVRSPVIEFVRCYHAEGNSGEAGYIS